MPSIADAVTQLRAADLPVLFADTCSLLDVIRTPLFCRRLIGCLPDDRLGKLTYVIHHYS